jgi:beta-galactosidase
MRRHGITRREFSRSVALAAGGAATARLFSMATRCAAATESATTTRRLADGWEFFRGGLGGIWDVWRRDQAADVVWKSVALPHCFNARDAVDPDGPFYEGAAWYRTRLDPANPLPNERTLLRFEGAGQKSEVYVGLERVADHEGGYDEFVVDITEAAERVLRDAKSQGKVPVAVRCDNSRDLEAIPSSLNDFYRYGGLYRHVNLVIVPAISLERVHIEPVIQPEGGARARVMARLYNPARLAGDLQVSVRISDPRGEVVYNASQRLAPWKGKREIGDWQVAQPLLWSPANPALYQCDVTLESEHGRAEASERFGFRWFEFVAHGPFKLNGERLPLRGTQREEDHALLGAAMPDDLVRRELELVKGMGANFLGLGHHPQARAVLNACDELGLLVLEEIPWSRGGLGGEKYKRSAHEMLWNMIDQHFNHPSVILWGMGNENDWPGDFPTFDQEKIRAFVTELNDAAHALDPSRKTFLRRCDFARELVDVYSPTIWAGWYHGPYTAYKSKAQREMEKVDRFLHVEWGADSHAGRHSEEVDRLLAKVVSGERADPHVMEYNLAGGQSNAPEKGDWSETYACNLFDWHLKEQEAMPGLAGSAQWIFKDFASPLRRANPVPFINQKGLVERDLRVKEGYYVFQSYWTTAPMIWIYGHSWPVRWGEAGEKKLVKVYSNCEAVELLANGVSYGVRKRDPQAFPAAGLHWLVAFQAGENQLHAIGHRNGRTVKDEIRLHYQTQRWKKPTQLELREVARDAETVILEVLLRDEARVPCFDARNRIRFGLTGDGTLVDNLGTAIGSRLVEAFNGRARIQVVTHGGKSVVGVSSEGLPSAFLTVG